MKFTVIPRSQRIPESGANEAYLRIDHWNDYSFVTMFEVAVFDGEGRRFELGDVKIGFVGQTEQTSTYSTLPDRFESLTDGYFSLGQDVDYYQVLSEGVPPDIRTAFLNGLKDIVIDTENYRAAAGQKVFSVSLLRSVGVSTIDGQYRRVLSGGVKLSDFNFGFQRPQSDRIAGIDLTFVVEADSTPSTNIHAIIGRNGVGKTSLLNEMTIAIVTPEATRSRFYEETIFEDKSTLSTNYFSGLVSVAFSAFDPFNPPAEQPDPEKGPQYYYIGLKDSSDDSGTLLKSLSTLRSECVASLGECFSNRGKRERWLSAISTLESDENFAHMNLGTLASLEEGDLRTSATRLVRQMSSGHAIVLLTITRLVAKVEEKTLVLLDEPESHLHPPLLAAFTRALSELLRNRNGVAIVATHSPVVLQEIPRSCSKIITRSRLSMRADPPRIETFGENVGVLTREVFGLEVTKSGFHSLLQSAVLEGKSYDEILEEYGDQIGQEARGILRAMVADYEARSALQ